MRAVAILFFAERTTISGSEIAAAQACVHPYSRSPQMIDALFHMTSVRSAPMQPPLIAQHIVRIWLALGILAVICIPTLRGSSEWFGALPFWLIGIPLANLLILRWRNVLGASRATFAQLRRRHAKAARHRVTRAGKKPRIVRRRAAQGQLGALVAGILR
jgi:hypothetical protein